MIDTVRTATGGGPASVVDLGCGPGSLSERLADALPEATIVGVDVDPLLLGLVAAQANPRVRLVEADLGNPGWPDVTGLPGPWDAGVFINADNMGLGASTMDSLADSVRTARTRRVGTEDNEDWGDWWQALLADDELAPLVDARSQRTIAHSGENGLTVGQHARLLIAAGFTEAAPVWQFGDDHVLVAVR